VSTDVVQASAATQGDRQSPIQGDGGAARQPGMSGSAVAVWGGGRSFLIVGVETRVFGRGDSGSGTR